MHEKEQLLQVSSQSWQTYYQLMKQRLSPKRLNHSIRVAECGLSLSQRFGGDPWKIQLAGLLHDGAKEMSNQELLTISQAANLLTDPAELANPSILHGPVAAWLAQTQWGIQDPVILQAIQYHTTGAAKLSLEARIVFLADLIEPNRQFQGVEILRTLAKQELNVAILEAIDQTFVYLGKKKQPVHQGMVACRQWLLTTMNDEGIEFR
jgi:predicted HD superfamily hydrolase involved in NAD metabolism